MDGVPLDISPVTDTIWVGAAIDRIDDAAAAQAAASVRDLGIGLVIDCRAEADDTDLWSGVAGVRYLKNGVHDSGEALPTDYFTSGVEAYFEHIWQGQGATLVHCEAGSNRSPALVLAILLAEGTSQVTAYDSLTKARPNFGRRYTSDAEQWFATYAG